MFGLPPYCTDERHLFTHYSSYGMTIPDGAKCLCGKETYRKNKDMRPAEWIKDINPDDWMQEIRGDIQIERD